MFTLNSRKTFIATVTALTFFCTPSLVAQEAPLTDEANKERGKRGHMMHLAKKFKRLDTDESRTLTLDEVTIGAVTKAEHKFERKDADGDGFLTFEEATNGRDVPDYSDIAEEIAQCVADLKEETGNEKIIVPDPDNYMSPQEKFDAVDSNGDGLLDLAEVVFHAETKATDKFNNWDQDASGEISFEEFAKADIVRKTTRRAIKKCIDEITGTDGF